MSAMAPPRFPPCPTSLSPEQIARFESDGYLAFEDTLTPDEVERAKAALSEVVGRTAGSKDLQRRGGWWAAAGGTMYLQFEPGYEPAEDADLDELERRLRKIQEYHDAHPHFAYLSTRHERLRGVLSSLLGPDPLLFQSMALVKPAFIGSEKPWHQDNAYFSVAPLSAVCGVWIALDAATVENGCMQVIPGGHHEGARRHVHRRDCEINADRIDPSRAVPIPLPPGGVLFFCGMLPHYTPPNASPDRRRALQFHYRAADSHLLEREEYDRLFAEPDGTPASCAADRERAAPTLSGA